MFPLHEVHKITQLDIRLANTDRNVGNILVQKSEDGERLVPIDHGYALPHTLEDVCRVGVLPQAKLPYSEETREYIADIDVDADIELREQGISSPARARPPRVHHAAPARGRGCPADIAGMMSRPMPNRMSDLEKLSPGRRRLRRRLSAPMMASWYRPKEPGGTTSSRTTVSRRGVWLSTRSCLTRTSRASSLRLSSETNKIR